MEEILLLDFLRKEKIMSTKILLRRVALISAAALAIGGVSAVSAQAAGINAPSAATQTLGAITRTSLTTWTEPVTITLTSTGLAAGQTVVITEANTGSSTATNAVPVYTLLAGDVLSTTSATFSTLITFSSLLATAASETAALGTQILTPNIGGFGGVVSAAVTIPGNPNLQATVASTFTGTTAIHIAGPANFVTITNYSATNSVYYTILGGLSGVGSAPGTAAGTVLPSGTFSVLTPSVGAITVSGYLITAGAASPIVTDTVTITVTGALPGTSYFGAAVLGAPGVTAPSTITDAAFSVTAASALPGNTVANFTVVENDANGLALTTGFKPLTIYSTLGVISVGGSGVGSVTASGGYAIGTPTGPMTFSLANNGQVGVATITVSVEGISVKSYHVSFTGAATKIVLTVVHPVIAVGVAATLFAATSSIYANTNALEIQEFDSTGNAILINTGAISITSSNNAVATAGAPSVAVGLLPVNFLGGVTTGTALSPSVAGVSLTGLAAGTVTFTATDSMTAVASAPVTVRVSSGVPTSVVLKTDSNSYSAGAVGTLTTTLSDPAGTLPAGTYLALSYAGATSSYALSSGASALPGASITVNDLGLRANSFNAPLSDGTVTISATGATATIVVTPATFTVASNATSSIKEATDAAKAAIVAATIAGASADAATAAAKSAGAMAASALAAVTALAVQVKAALAKLTTLTALVVRLIKKAKA